MKRVSEIRIVPEHLVHFLSKHGKSPYKALPLCSRTRDVIFSNHHLRINCTNVFKTNQMHSFVRLFYQVANR